MENNRPSWDNAARKLSEESNKKTMDYTPKKSITLKEFEPDTYEKYKELISEFEMRVKNTFSHLATVYHDKEVVINVLSAYYDSIEKTDLFLEIAQKNAALYIELKRIFLVEFYEARKKIGEDYDKYKFL